MTTAVFLNLIDALGHVEGLAPPAYRAICRCAASVLLPEPPAPAVARSPPIEAAPERKKPGKRAKATPSEIAERRAAASRKWRKKKLKAEKTGRTKQAKAKGKRGSDSEAALRGWQTRRRLRDQRAADAKAAAATNGSTPAADTGNGSTMLKKNDPRLVPAKSLLQAHLMDSDFVPVSELEKAALARGIDGIALASAAAYLGLKISHRGGTAGFGIVKPIAA